jgi:glycosyltransferase involved in cell wall biosynthesis
MADVDVLIPHYNDPVGLKKSVDSVLAQDFTGTFRIVVVDDGSQSINVKAVKDILNRSGLVYDLIECKVNKGRPFVRNILLQNISSSFVTWLDAGDEWYSQKTTQQIEKAREYEEKTGSQHYWVTCNYDWQPADKFDKDYTRRICNQKVSEDVIKDLLIGSDLRAYLWTLLAPAEAFQNVGKFDERLPRLQDLDFFLRFALSGGTFVKPDKEEPLCVYHKSFAGRNAKEVWESHYYIFNKFQVLYNRYGRTFKRKRLYELHRHASQFAKKNGNNALHLRYKFKAIATRPIHSIKKALSVNLRSSR